MLDWATQHVCRATAPVCVGRQWFITENENKREEALKILSCKPSRHWQRDLFSSCGTFSLFWLLVPSSFATFFLPSLAILFLCYPECFCVWRGVHFSSVHHIFGSPCLTQQGQIWVCNVLTTAHKTILSPISSRSHRQPLLWSRSSYGLNYTPTPHKKYVEHLLPRNSKCDFIWKWDHCRCNELRWGCTAVGWAPKPV